MRWTIVIGAIGRSSDDAPLGALAATEGIAPEAGWVELTLGPGDSTFVNAAWFPQTA